MPTNGSAASCSAARSLVGIVPVSLVDDDVTQYGAEQSGPPRLNSDSLDEYVATLERLTARNVYPGRERRRQGGRGRLARIGRRQRRLAGRGDDGPGPQAADGVIRVHGLVGRRALAVRGRRR